MDTFERRWRLLEILLEGAQMRETIVDKLYKRVNYENGDPNGLSASNLSADVKALRHMGIGFRALNDTDKRAKQAYELDYPLLTVFAHREDARALFTASRILSQLKLPEAGNLDRLYARIPSPVRDGLESGYEDSLLQEGGASVSLEAVHSLQQALLSKKPLEITYQPLEKDPRRFYVETGYLSWIDGSLYLVAHCPKEKGETDYHRNREFRIDRFVRMDPYPLVEVHKNDIRRITKVPTFKLKFMASPSFAPRFVPIPGKVSLGSKEPDGSRLIIITETIPLRAVRRILSYGSLVTVEGPDFVINELQETLNKMLNLLNNEE